jgi:Tfp pilus tip-associated adhesin PilY1
MKPLQRYLSALLCVVTLVVYSTLLRAAGEDTPVDRVTQAISALDEQAKVYDGIMEAANKNLADKIKTIQHADDYYEKLKDDIKKTAAQGAPESEFVQNLETLRIEAIKDAEDAATTPDTTEYVAAFKKQAEVFSDLKEAAIQNYDESARHIREIETKKKQVIMAIKLKNYQQAEKVARESLQHLQEYTQKLSAAKTELQSLLPDEKVPQ